MTHKQKLQWAEERLEKAADNLAHYLTQNGSFGEYDEAKNFAMELADSILEIVRLECEEQRAL